MKFKGAYNFVHSITQEEYEFYNAKVSVNDMSRQIDISRRMRGQAKTTEWEEERSTRITGYNRQKYPWEKLVDNLTKSKFFKSIHTS